MRIALTLAAIAIGVLLGVAPAVALEQTITPLTPPDEQHVEVLGGGAEQEHVAGVDSGQQVVDVDTGQLATVEPHEPPSPAAKTASTAGKVVLGVTAAAVALGAMAASLLFM